MNRLTIFTAAAAAAILCTLPAFAQEQPNQNSGFVTLDLNWTQGSAPAESQLDGDTMRQMLERDEARVRMIQPRENDPAACQTGRTKERRRAQGRRAKERDFSG